MTNLRQAAQQTLDALEQLDGIDTETECVTIDVGDAITALRKALEQPAQEPVIRAWSLREVYFDEDGEPLMHRSPPAAQRQWVGLEAEDLAQIESDEFWQTGNHMAIAMAVEAKLKERNYV